jgi:peptide-methionine (S)-S-oxide reductase
MKSVNQQGADRGTQYRSAIFYNSDVQKKTAEELIQELNASGTWENPIVTEISPLHNFYPAEDNHQDYYNRNSEVPYCRLVIDPKVAKLRRLFTDKLKKPV